MFQTQAIGNILRNGVAFDLKNWETQELNSDRLVELAQRLFDRLESQQIDYLLVGGLALLSYVEGRNTQDIDFILSRDDLDRLPELVLSNENQDFARGQFEDLQVDLLLTRNPLFQQVQQTYSTQQVFGSQRVRCVTVEGLLILKLYALPSLYRQGNFTRASLYENDIRLLLLNYEVDRASLLQMLTPHLLASDLQVLQETLQDIQTQIIRLKAQQQRLEFKD
ncbi:MAG: nucleotidyltransferase family protein [Timaviella obliquedivisa GSE-PSE-MK23-08B]|jgi:hypothetical protein|nr:nucleotidyltransferase family protein [Timaviella obliquedivisa GSE-PSE-MK23-08B]